MFLSLLIKLETMKKMDELSGLNQIEMQTNTNISTCIFRCEKCIYAPICLSPKMGNNLVYLNKTYKVNYNLLEFSKRISGEEELRL